VNLHFYKKQRFSDLKKKSSIYLQLGPKEILQIAIGILKPSFSNNKKFLYFTRINSNKETILSKLDFLKLQSHFV